MSSLTFGLITIERSLSFVSNSLTLKDNSTIHHEVIYLNDEQPHVFYAEISLSQLY